MRGPALAALATLAALLPALAQTPNRPNILFVISDDLRADVSIYNPAAPIPTPRLSKLAQSALVFNNAYVQFALCGPSRNSFLSSRRPDALQSWNFLTSMRALSQQVVSLPQAFKQAGYFTVSIGKVFHIYQDIWDDGATSWSAIDYSPGPGDGDGGCSTNIMWCQCQGQCADSLIAQDAVQRLRNLNAMAQPPPFFMAIGFRRPHPDFMVPSNFTSGFQSAQISVAQYSFAPNFSMPSGMPTVAFYSCDNVVGRFPFTGNVGILPWGGVPASAVVQVRKAYWTAGAYMDYQLGVVLDALASTKFQSNTIIVFTADHGWNLGERGMWCKQSNFETTTRVPLLISVPWMSASHFGKRTNAVVELIDIMPTLLSLVGLPAPPCLEGNDLTAVLSNPEVNKLTTQDPFGGILSSSKNGPSGIPAWQQSWALSQYPRCDMTGNNPWNNPCSQIPSSSISYMGYTLRTGRWRYTEWRVWLGMSADWSAAGLNSTELYDHDGDDGSNYDAFENLNVASQYSAVVPGLSLALRLAVLQPGYPRACLPLVIQTANPTPLPTLFPTPPLRSPTPRTRAPTMPTRSPTKERTLPPDVTSAPSASQTPSSSPRTSSPQSLSPSELPSASPTLHPTTVAPTQRPGLAPTARTRHPVTSPTTAPLFSTQPSKAPVSLPLSSSPSSSSDSGLCLSQPQTCSVSDWTCGTLITNNCGEQITCPCWQVVESTSIETISSLESAGGSLPSLLLTRREGVGLVVIGLWLLFW